MFPLPKKQRKFSLPIWGPIQNSHLKTGNPKMLTAIAPSVPVASGPDVSGPERTNTHEHTIHSMSVMTQLWMNIN